MEALKRIIDGNGDSHILPFYWMQYVNAVSGKSAWNPGRILISAAPDGGKIWIL